MTSTSTATSTTDTNTVMTGTEPPTVYYGELTVIPGINKPRWGLHGGTLIASTQPHPATDWHGPIDQTFASVRSSVEKTYQERINNKIKGLWPYFLNYGLAARFSERSQAYVEAVKDLSTRLADDSLTAFYPHYTLKDVEGKTTVTVGVGSMSNLGEPIMVATLVPHEIESTRARAERGEKVKQVDGRTTVTSGVGGMSNLGVAMQVPYEIESPRGRAKRGGTVNGGRPDLELKGQLYGQ